ncbi:MAG TPA: HDIG domain-containing protein [Firmicutes bacterium]|nr:HDIG domain-containing protein [Bacillota bacterium]
MSKPQISTVARWVPWLNREILRQPELRRWTLAVLVYVAMLSMVAAPLWSRRYDFTVGQVAPYDVEATRTVVDRERTERLRMEARQRAVEQVLEDPQSYIINQTAVLEAESAAQSVFSLLRRGQAPFSSPAALQTPEEIQRRILLETGLDLPVALVKDALQRKPADLDRLAAEARTLVGRVMTQQRIDEGSLDGVRRAAEEVVRKAAGGDRQVFELMRRVVQGVLRPNLALDPDRLPQAERAASAVEPVRILKGQTIIRKGDIVTPEHVRYLELLGLRRAQATYSRLGGASVILFLLLAVLGIYLRHFQPEVLKNENLFALLGFVLVLLAFVAKLLTSVDWIWAGFVIPIAFGTMLTAILLDSRLAVLVTAVLAVFVGLLTDQDLRFVLVALAGGLAGLFAVSRMSQRGDLMRAGLIVGAVNAVTIAGLGLFASDPATLEASWLGLANGILSSILAIGSLAYLETMFGLTSAAKLLELSNPNQRLLRRLLLEAPGTYHHSIMVGNLAEAAAEATHGDPLLARVGAYYHDVGKLRRPYFFVENQFAGENPHDKIAPGLSTLIITSHVKDGVELAREAKLPACVIDFIQQHHGTDLVRYFFHRAQENSREVAVSESDFRYQGPKPQTKEAAIVMLADTVEAAVRTLQRPTPGRVEGLVRKLIRDRLVEGQLDESDLTLKDLDRIAAAFVRVLSGMFHGRVEYPDGLARELEGRKSQA